MEATLYYFHDPMCSWCWGFSPAWKKLCDTVTDEVSVEMVLGGLSPDSNEPMPEQMQQYLQQTWRTIEAKIPGARFNHDFWTHCSPRRSTYPSCRSVIAARLQGREFESKMVSAIQHGYYLEAKNPSDEETLAGFGETIGLDVGQFLQDLNSPHTHQTLTEEMAFSRSLGVQGFPSLALVKQERVHPVNVDFLDPMSMVAAIREVQKSG